MLLLVGGNSPWAVEFQGAKGRFPHRVFCPGKPKTGNVLQGGYSNDCLTSRAWSSRTCPLTTHRCVMLGRDAGKALHIACAADAMPQVVSVQ